MELVDGLAARAEERDVRRLDLFRQPRQPEVGLAAGAEADGGALELHHLHVAERRERGRVEGHGPGEVTHAKRDMVDHGPASYTKAALRQRATRSFTARSRGVSAAASSAASTASAA